MAKTEGLHPFHFGFVLGDNIFPPSEFANAWVGVQNPKDLATSLDSTVDKILAGELTEEDIPVLHELVTQANDDGERFDLDNLREMVKYAYGTTKAINRIALKEVNKSNQIGTLSRKNQFSAIIDSRRIGQIERARDISLYNPFLAEDLDNAYSFRFYGGTLHAQKNRAKNNHWSGGLEHEEHFVVELAKMTEARFAAMKTFYKVNARQIVDDYYRPINVADYDVACALTGLAQIIKNQDTSLVKGLGSKERRVLLPFDFDRNPQYAFEAFIRFSKKPKKKGELSKSEKKQRLFEIDNYFIGKSGIVTSEFAELFRQGQVQRGVLIHDKRFTKYSWAVIQAWEEYCYKEGRRFSGYSLEFAGTPFQTVSIVLDDPIRDLSVRILHDDSFGMPYIMYKDFSPEGGMPQVHKLGDKNPRSMIYKAKDLPGPQGRQKKWIETDYRTGKDALCFIYEPTEEIRERASELSRNAGRGISSYTLRTRYIENMFGPQMRR